MENYWMEPIRVKHKDLKRSDEESMFRSVCPVCKKGHLMMRRNVSDGMKLQLDDNCTLCGTRFIYTDIIEDSSLVYKSEKNFWIMFKEILPFIALIAAFLCFWAIIHFSR